MVRKWYFGNNMFWLLLEYYGSMSKKRKAKLRIFAVHFLRFDSFSKSHRLWRGELGKLEIGMCVHAMIAHHLDASLGKFGDLVGIWKIQTGTNLTSFVPTLFFTGGKAVGMYRGLQSTKQTYSIMNKYV